ncbi:hypothetical protein D5S17_08520 [Pseudonocardiaceae bacterium YIM PH 21723]|nr:hypothetical protein D5S17_08520 [Pseudonocardiaceae bacterium YIM PH 21723]
MGLLHELRTGASRLWHRTRRHTSDAVEGIRADAEDGISRLSGRAGHFADQAGDWAQERVTDAGVKAADLVQRTSVRAAEIAQQLTAKAGDSAVKIGETLTKPPAKKDDTPE